MYVCLGRWWVEGGGGYVSVFVRMLCACMLSELERGVCVYRMRLFFGEWRDAISSQLHTHHHTLRPLCRMHDTKARVHRAHVQTQFTRAAASQSSQLSPPERIYKCRFKYRCGAREDDDDDNKAVSVEHRMASASIIPSALNGVIMALSHAAVRQTRGRTKTSTQTLHYIYTQWISRQWCGLYGEWCRDSTPIPGLNAEAVFVGSCSWMGLYDSCCYGPVSCRLACTCR